MLNVAVVAGVPGAPGTDPVISAYTTSSLRQRRLLDGFPLTGIIWEERSGGAWTQVSRLAMLLVNDVVIGLDDKDKFNASHSRNDTTFADYVTSAVLPTVLQSQFPSATSSTNFPRIDLINVFLKGIEGVNQPAAVTAGNGVMAEMLRLNTSIPVTPQAS
jgi:hypothetical protein